MYIAGTLRNYKNRIHQLPTGVGDISNFVTEGDTYFSSVAINESNHWERELRKKKYNITHDPSHLITQLLNSDIYSGKLVYTRDGLGDTVVDDPSGAYNLTFATNKVTAIHCHDCPLITSITCTTNSLLTVLDLENCITLTNLNFNDCPTLSVVNLNTFTTAGDWIFSNCEGITSFTATSLITADNINLSNLASGGPTAIVGTLSFPSLISVAGAIYVYGFGFGTSLTGFSAPLLTSAGEIFIATHNNLTLINMPSLQDVITSINLSQNNGLETISLPSLQSATSLSMYSCAVLTNVNIDAIVEIFESIICANCPNLLSIEMPVYNSLLSSNTIDFSGCVSLNSFSAGIMEAFDGAAYNFYNCSLDEASVNGLIQSLTNTSTVSVALDISGGSNSAPDATHAAQVIALNLAGNTVATN